MRVILNASLLVFAVSIVVSCRGTIPIGTLLDDPGRYDGETVRISGEVTGSIGALGTGAYRVDDGSGTINVVSETRGAPREGAVVGVEGRFESVFTLGTESTAVILETGRFDP